MHRGCGKLISDETLKFFIETTVCYTWYRCPSRLSRRYIRIPLVNSSSPPSSFPFHTRVLWHVSTNRAWLQCRYVGLADRISNDFTKFYRQRQSWIRKRIPSSTLAFVDLCAHREFGRCTLPRPHRVFVPKMCERSRREASERQNADNPASVVRRSCRWRCSLGSKQLNKKRKFTRSSSCNFCCSELHDESVAYTRTATLRA